MSQSRPPTSTGGAIAMVLVGGAVATGATIVLSAFATYPSPEMLSFRTSTGLYLFNCAICGLVTALGLLLCRPRGPLPPILAAVSALVAFEVGKRIGSLLALMIGLEHMPDGMVSAIMKPHFNKYFAYELLAVVIAGGLGALRVASSGGFGPGGGQRPPAWTGPQPAAGYGQPGQPQPGQPGMAFPGQPPMAPPGQPYGPPAGPPMQPPAPSGRPSFAPPPGGAPAPGGQPPPPSGPPLNAPPPGDHQPPPDMTPGGPQG
ncbi:hypothetical protein F8568_014110 [Actinomadura sp. LD22]|uniref:Uncharacterized protein n=1 Tax=Actinomadura physcomitrii TaxID=2650748 RepID=A0A6I4M6T7_9ACTN|nr:hypothetical protein [Actinomadura physcomitrii]MWA01493.1 hypothetical protein [Actinomadura physcomitrii]